MPSSGQGYGERYLEGAENDIGAGNWRGARKRLETFLRECPDDLALVPLRMEAHLKLVRILAHLTDLDGAQEHCEEAFELSKRSFDEIARARILRWRGHISWKKGEYDSSLDNIDRALEIAGSKDDLELEGILHIERAMVHSTRGNLGGAERDYMEAILALEKAGEKEQLARAYNNLGDNFMTRGKYERAIGFFSKSKDMARKVGARGMLGFAGFNRAESLFELGRYDEALDELDQSLPLLEEVGDRYGQAGANQIYGLVYAKMEDWNRAEEYLIRARRLAQKNAMPVSEAKIIRDIGRMYRWRGDKEKAILYIKEAREIFERHGADGEIQKMSEDLEDLY